MYLCSQIEFIQGLLFWQEEKKEQINKHNDTPSNKRRWTGEEVGMKKAVQCRFWHGLNN